MGALVVRVPVELAGAGGDGERNPDGGAGEAIFDAQGIGERRIEEVLITHGPGDADIVAARGQGLHLHAGRRGIDDHAQICA